MNHCKGKEGLNNLNYTNEHKIWCGEVHTEVAFHPGTLVLLELCDSIAQKSDDYFLLGKKRYETLE